jgi:hypothetical protein
VPSKQIPAFVRLGELQNLPHKRHGFRIFTHTAPGARSNPEISGKYPERVKCPEGVSNPIIVSY